ncbi:MAG: pseudaminic acid synthase [Candidatus Magasanikbacteria bacterium RIFCSPLOWO2_01_FULL_43_20b]|uniref:Pseudaminic acid synthase n=1 Tax=Candidatus Magasanikbacteria bacterium RIFCSPLOWO2_12_FULL_43_12 TaxID=1798692 RepID=A0A1F6MS18_9BACT|nr:MAG: pseudaminic acid synthase [Candidatus Magasanikbacteria bacterium RIFCSPHIGHO2_02_FULL_44_13]OGH72574.1 MAG: pseudaminic acid synthase [Candidatus Magasanikbacteria bacterium RIFCSPLOWO2_02_FULL_43_22]OGH73313.1 MAG: pseudaminic acid synthase [Candidatus Magasanikbacteria bacterium RIFCSPLOWO2_01_FULL_43_20b]OGH74320.1 MAG: pseudaminic acid synthase [Candidatus Magasanikbacteria bacterium RIFCSPLOWO2_12_FULL_43_12]
MKPMIINTPKGKRKIGPGNPAFIIAEMSGNHNQDFNRALKIIDAAAAAGVDAVKLQTYTPDTITMDSDKDYFRVKIKNVWQDQILYNLYKQAYTPWDWQPKLKKYGENKGLVVFSTPFDNTAVDFLEKMKVSLYKIASYEVGDIPLLKRVGQTKKSVIMSRGMASKAEIQLAIKTLKEAGASQVATLHCVSAYPATAEQMNLATIPDLAKRFKVISGLSDHTLGITASVASIVLGANIIEKHLTLRRADGGPDATFSLEPGEFKDLVQTVREAEATIGKPNYELTEGEKIGVLYRKSLFVVKDIKAGEKFTPQNVRSIRPGHGLPPKYYEEILGRAAKVDIERGEPLDRGMVRR